MSDWQPSNKEQAAAMATVAEYARRVMPIIGYSLHPSLDGSFRRFHAMVYEAPTAELLQKWGSKNEKWRHMLVSGVGSNAQESLSIAAYHAGRIKYLDQSVEAALQGLPLAPNEGVAGGDTTIMNAEYQAFILACRRCLDQLTYALSAVFKNELSSFTDLSSFLRKQKLVAIADPLISIYEKHEARFDGWLVTRAQTGQSLRDALSHRRSIKVGTLNVSHSGVRFVGFDAPKSDFSGKRISDVVEDLFFSLHSYVEETVDQLTLGFSEFLVEHFDDRK